MTVKKTDKKWRSEILNSGEEGKGKKNSEQGITEMTGK